MNNGLLIPELGNREGCRTLGTRPPYRPKVGEKGGAPKVKHLFGKSGATRPHRPVFKNGRILAKPDNRATEDHQSDSPM